MLTCVKNCLKGWLCKEDILALNACVIDWRKKIEKVERERDEARMEAVKWKTAACRLAEDKNIYYIDSEQPFTWELPNADLYY